MPGYNVTRNTEIKLTLTLCNNIYVVSFKRFHEEATDHKICERRRRKTKAKSRLIAITDQHLLDAEPQLQPTCHTNQQ